jgi:hypothetical protein
LLAYALTDFSECGVALMIALAVLALDGVSRDARYAAVGVGLAVGGAVLFRTDSLIDIAPIVGVVLLLLARHRVRAVVLCALGAAPCLAIWITYNVARFDAPFSSGYRFQTFSHPFLSGLYGLTLSPSRGAFIYVPLLLVALAGLTLLRGSSRVLGWMAIALLAARVLLFARWWSWYGGDVWGPRFIVPVIPAFAIPLAACVEQWGRRTFFRAAALASATLSVLGFVVVLRPGLNGYVAPPLRGSDAESTMAYATSSQYVRATDARMFDWASFPFGPAAEDSASIPSAPASSEGDSDR